MMTIPWNPRPNGGTAFAGCLRLIERARVPSALGETRRHRDSRTHTMRAVHAVFSTNWQFASDTRRAPRGGSHMASPPTRRRGSRLAVLAETTESEEGERVFRNIVCSTAVMDLSDTTIVEGLQDHFPARGLRGERRQLKVNRMDAAFITYRRVSATRGVPNSSSPAMASPSRRTPRHWTWSVCHSVSVISPQAGPSHMMSLTAASRSRRP